MIALLALAIVVLACLIVHLGSLAREEQRSQSRSHPKWIEDRDAKYDYTTERTYDYAKAVSAKSKAKLRAKRKRQELDQKAIEAAKERRGEVAQMADRRRA